MVYFVPTSKRWLGPWQATRDTLDAFLSLLLFNSGVTRTFWRYGFYLALYGRTLAPAAAQRLFSLASWQAWELAVAGQLRLVVVKIIAAQESSPNPDAELVSYRKDTFDSDFKNLVIPRVREAVRAELKIQPGLPAVVLSMIGIGILTISALLSLAAVAVVLLASATV